MHYFDEPNLMNFQQFPPWSTSNTRPRTSLPWKSGSDMFKLGIENRNQIELSSKKRLIRHNIYIPSDLRSLSPPGLTQPTPTPDVCSTTDPNSSVTSIAPTPVPIKSSSFTIPMKTNSGESLFKNFPKQTHERRKMTQERRRQKQLKQKYADGDAEHWFRLRQSLAELKHLATTEEILLDPSTSIFNCNGYSFEALKQAIQEQEEQKKINRLKSESGLSPSFNTIRSVNTRSRISLTRSRNSVSHHQATQPLTRVYPRPLFEPLIVAVKPLHPLLLTGNDHSLKNKSRQIQPPGSALSRVRLPHSFSSTEKRIQLTLSDLSYHEDLPISSTPSLQLQNIDVEEEEEERNTKTSSRILSDDQRPSSRLSLKSTIKLKSSLPRCRSANDGKHSFTLNKTSPRFLLITDEEHRIESWYHQYPFIISDELLQSFQTKPTKSVVSAYFIDDHQHANLIHKSHLQGKAFHLNNDWKKYDLIFISKSIYQDIILYLQTMIKLTGKIISIYQINHHEDLKSQVRFYTQQFLSHV